MTDDTRSDPAVALGDLISRIESGDTVLRAEDLSVLRDLAREIEASRQVPARIAEWIRARADLALAREPDPEQPGHEEFTRGWSHGSHNTLHIAANAVEDGRAALPRDQWPPYMRGERIVRAAGPTETMETSDGASPPSA
jgi:hypothetical protein